MAPEAKAVEVTSWPREKAVEAVQCHVPYERLVHMRWVLTYTPLDSNDPIVGFEG